MFFGRSDAPLNESAKPSADELDVRAYEEGLYEFVRNCETPMTVGLQGEWGSGKTSMMRGVERRLRSEDTPDGSVLSFWFETWQYGAVGAADTLGMLLLRDLTNRLMEGLEEQSKLHVRHRLQRALRAAMPAAAGVLTSVATRSEMAGEAVSSAASAALGKGEDDVRACFQKLVTAALAGRGDQNARVVVFIDDLDRVPPKLAVQLLEVLKNFMDVERCVFVVACDYEVVREGVHELMGITSDDDKRRRKEKVDAFFHKLFQVQFLMPVGAYQIDKLFDRYVKARLDEENKSNPRLGRSYRSSRRDEFLTSGYVRNEGVRLQPGWFKQLTRVVELAIGTNPRSFKRFLNLVDLTCRVDKAFGAESKLARWEIGSPEHDEETRRWCTALFPIVALQQRWPRVAAYLLGDALVCSRPRSTWGDAEITNFERRLRTLTGRWPANEDPNLVADEFVAEDFRILLSEVFGGDIRTGAPAAAAADLVAFGKAWFDLLDANADRRLDPVTELDVIGKWSKRLGNMGATRIQPTGMAKFYNVAMEADPVAGDAFYGLASRLVNVCRDDGLEYLVPYTSESGATWTVAREGRRPTNLMNFTVKGTQLDIQLNVREGATPVRYLPRILELAAALEQVLEEQAVPRHYTTQRVHVHFGEGYTSEREEPVRAAFVAFLRDVDRLALEAGADEAPATEGD